MAILTGFGDVRAATSGELGGKLLRTVGEERAAAEKSGSSAKLQVLENVATLIRTLLTVPEQSPRHIGEGDLQPEVWKEMLKDFPELAKTADEWQTARVKEYTVWAEGACCEMETSAKEAAAVFVKARSPEELDVVLRRLSELQIKYPAERGAQGWPVWGSCARNIMSVLEFGRIWQRLLAFEQAGERVAATRLLSRAWKLDSIPGMDDSQVIALLNDTAGRLGILS